MTTTSASEALTPTLSFTSLNDDKPTTIVLLHGGFTSRLEFALVVPHLSDFHVLAPDMPLHSGSRHISPGTTDEAARHVARLIESHAHGGKAHVVGMSMGGFIGQCLALDRPDLVLSLFVSGAVPAVGARLFFARWTSFTYYTMRIMLHWMPAWVFKYQSAQAGMPVSDELLEDMRGNIRWEVVRDMFPWILEFSLDHVRQLKVRVLSVAGAKGDDVPTIKEVAGALRSRRTEHGEPWPEDGSGSVAIMEASHGWDLQLPELFARGVLAWVREERLPDEFERM